MQLKYSLRHIHLNKDNEVSVFLLIDQDDFLVRGSNEDESISFIDYTSNFRIRPVSKTSKLFIYNTVLDSWISQDSVWLNMPNLLKEHKLRILPNNQGLDELSESDLDLDSLTITESKVNSPLHKFNLEIQNISTGEQYKTAEIEVYDYNYYMEVKDHLAANNHLDIATTKISKDLNFDTGSNKEETQSSIAKTSSINNVLDISGEYSNSFNYFYLIPLFLLIFFNKPVKKMLIYFYDFSQKMVTSNSNVPFYLYCLVYAGSYSFQ